MPLEGSESETATLTLLGNACLPTAELSFHLPALAIFSRLLESAEASKQAGLAQQSIVPSQREVAHRQNCLSSVQAAISRQRILKSRGPSVQCCKSDFFLFHAAHGFNIISARLALACGKAMLALNGPKLPC